MLHFTVKLRRERFVMRQHHSGALRALDHLRHGVGFARTGHPQQHLILLMRRQPRHQLIDRLRLIALRRIIRNELKGRRAGLHKGRMRFRNAHAPSYRAECTMVLVASSRHARHCKKGLLAIGRTPTIHNFRDTMREYTAGNRVYRNLRLNS